MANGNAQDAHYSCTLGHLINNSYRLGTKVPFNAKAGRFGDNKEAYEHFMKLHALMRDGVGVPEDKAEYIVGPWLTGVMHDVSGSYALAFWISTALSAVSIVAIWRAGPRKVRMVAGRVERLAKAA